MRKLLFCLLLLSAGAAQAQTSYYNEWIDFSKTYYKFKVGTNGLYRIPASALGNAGMGAVPAEQFQLWRHGQQVPVYTSVAAGPLGSSDYIEFWGEMNDGKADSPLYRNADFQLNDKWSLETDSATYFLTINNGSNLRLTNTANNVAANTLPAEAYFMHTAGNWYRDRIHAGYAVNVGEWLYSSSYDQAEGWSSGDVGMGQTRTVTINNLYYYDGGIDANIKVNVSGNAINPRRYTVSINGDSVWGNNVDYFLYDKGTADFSNGNLVSNTAAIQIKNNCPTPGDRMVLHKVELTYPRLYNFDNRSSFEFFLPESPVGNYLEITNFNGGTTPVLYDLTNGQRYVADVSGGLYRVVLQPSAVPRRLVMVNTNASVTNNITILNSRTFVNYSLPPQQADYLIISNKALTNGAGGTNPVEEYRQYRSSALGGSYNAKVFFIDDLVDQFGYGIKMHPLAVRNFIRYAMASYATQPKHVFLMGRGVTYNVQRGSEANPDLWRMHFVPTWGNPASDVLFTADPGTTVPKVPIGRLSVINAAEIAVYLKKVKEHESAQHLSSPLTSDKAWMKNVMHIVGASEPGLQAILDDYMRKYKRIIQDTLFGAKVTTFTKTSPEAVEQLNNGAVDKLFADGITLMLYFGHSSSGTLDFNLNNPDQYNNPGKYPLFIALGCNAGNFFTLNGQRLVSKETLSEKYTLAQDRGTIGFIASSHFGIVHYLDIYNTKMYQDITHDYYGATVGELMLHAIDQTMQYTGPDDFYARAQSEESILHGDPAIRLNPHPKADYVVEDPMVKVSPTVVSVADQSFKLNARFLNIGRAVGDSVMVEVKREYPNKATEVIYQYKLPALRYADSIDIDVPIEPLRDKGVNKVTVTVDAGNLVDELFENNNSITKEFFIIEDEARPIYPFNYAVVGRQDVKLVASTANPLSVSKTYRMEMDTTEQFNSALLRGNNITSGGGIIEFTPPVSFTDSTVYYWRIGQEVNGSVQKWNVSSFTYIPNQQGFSQGHVHQHLKSAKNEMFLSANTGIWDFKLESQSLFARNAIFPTGGNLDADFTVSVNGDPYMRSACVGRSLLFNVFDFKTGLPWKNVDAAGNNLFRYGSGSANCRPGRQNNFEFSYMSAGSRKLIMDFMDSIPADAYVVVRSFDSDVQGYASSWLTDTLIHGSGVSLYHKLKDAGFSSIDSVNRPRAWILIYQKGARQLQPRFSLTEGVFDKTNLGAEIFTSGSNGSVISPAIGPAKSWNSFVWSGNQREGTGDNAYATVIGVRSNGAVDTLFRNISWAQGNTSISSIDPQTYPYLKLLMNAQDTVYGTPYQLAKWGVYYTPVPEGAVAANLAFTGVKDSVEVGEGNTLSLAFKNISEQPFDSLKARITLTDNNNVTHTLIQGRFKPLAPGDTLHLRTSFNSSQYTGLNSLMVDFNPDNDQPEQYRFNNILFQRMKVAADSLNPLLDVTFDNVHILNNDIVSARPEIMMKLKDNARFLRLDDTSLIKVRVRFPTGELLQFRFNNDTLRFIPAPANSTDENAASVAFNPAFLEDGTYELLVSAQDKSNNAAGALDYKVAFRIINKPMISNMLNYPNPFTTSTAFVFTLTGSEVPQNIKIQVLTVTGKVVREITKNELGPLRIGRNITEFKWDGTDQYGQQLANGVYLYRVVTNLNGKSLEKYSPQDGGDANFQNTDKYFNKGYGKMYLMR